MFCGCSTDYDGAAPNTHVCPVCLGLPGALPVINRQAVEFVIATGLAIEAAIPERTQWERKNYFYPDLPKGYQISQYAIPLAAHGRLAIETSDGPFTVDDHAARTSRRTRPSSSTRTCRRRPARAPRSSTSTAPARRSWRS